MQIQQTPLNLKLSNLSWLQKQGFHRNIPGLWKAASLECPTHHWSSCTWNRTGTAKWHSLDGMGEHDQAGSTKASPPTPCPKQKHEMLCCPIEVNHLKDISTYWRTSHHPQAPTTDLSQAPTHLSKSVKRLTRNVCCLSSLYPSAFFTASTAWAGEAYSRKMYLSEKASSLHTCTFKTYYTLRPFYMNWDPSCPAASPRRVTLKTRVQHADQVVS